MSKNSKAYRFVGPLLVAIGVFALVASAARSPVMKMLPPETASADVENDPIVQKVDHLLAERWRETNLTPAPEADDLTIFRRLSLVLHGTTPSIEEIRVFESDMLPNRIKRWTERLLADHRFADYFARRFTRVFVGTLNGEFIIFRRDRFWAWLGDQFHANRPYDQIVRDMIAGRGLWTDKPEVNFISAAISMGVVDHNKLAGRTVRAFLGQRIDCAQCHNHPFASWKQAQFEGLAACYRQISFTPVGIDDNQKKKYTVNDRMTLLDREVDPAVPFHPEWMPDEGRIRGRLADWVTHPENRRFERAIVNRVWGLMFGRPWIQPVDDLPNPNESGVDPNDLLDILGADFRENGCNLQRLISTIAATRVFRNSSQHPAYESGERAEEVDLNWAAFPITRLRPEQVIGSMLQASSIKTVDQDSHWTKRAMRFFQELDFVRDYGDLGDDELNERASTIPQALLRMNSKFASEWTKGTIFSAAGRISAMAPSDEACVDLCFLACLTRHPTLVESATFSQQLQGLRRARHSQVVEDMFWTFFNSPEFCWEH